MGNDVENHNVSFIFIGRESLGGNQNTRRLDFLVPP
jgi:hypothetical protein